MLIPKSRVEVGRRSERGRSACDAVLTEGRHRVISQLRETRGVPDRGALGRQLSILACVRVRCAKLFELPPQVLLLALSTRPEPLEVADLVDLLGPGRMRGGYSGSQLDRPGVPVQ